jgi:hypothetical protein
MKLLNINPPGEAPSLLNIDFIASIEIWRDPSTNEAKGTVIRMGYLAARDDQSAPVKHVTQVQIGTIIQKLQRLGAALEA